MLARAGQIVASRTIERVKHFYVPTLGLQASDRKARAAAKAGCLGKVRNAASAGLEAQPFGKAGERPGHCVAARLRYPNRCASCALLPGLSPVFVGT
ncbi:hypothetical protein CBP34_14930 [Acidovorax carolinensis]|uniref:Uncharacterized protein n=1 Tax=Acidovorax carolinensis TaxID=553814 RepID=A0A240U4F9_9BURK|nr:hypothetical protein CBP34_14930 [Acidovorax carolinensis]